MYDSICWRGFEYTHFIYLLFVPSIVSVQLWLRPLATWAIAANPNLKLLQAILRSHSNANDQYCLGED